MRGIWILLLLAAVTLPAQQVARPLASYRYEEVNFGTTFITNWFMDLHYANLPQGRTYRRQISETGIWRDSGAPDIVVPIIPDAMASFSEAINILPNPPPIHFFRLIVVTTNTASATKAQKDMVMKDQPVVRTVFGKRQRFKRPVVIQVAPHAKLLYQPTGT